MTNSTTEFWDLNGVSLHQYAWSIMTIGGTRYALPVLRGSNIQFAYKPGNSWRPKVADSRVISMAMFVAGIDPATSNPGITWDQEVTKFNDNLFYLRKLFWTPGNQAALTRRWKATNPSTGLSQVYSAIANVELAGPMEPTMTGRTRCTLIVDLLLADPYFYGPSQAVTVPIGAASTTNPGDDAASYANFTVKFVGPLVSPTLTNTSANPDISVTLNTSIASGDSVTIDIGNFTATRQSDGANLTGAVSHLGARPWFSILSGANSLTLTATGTGNAVVTYQPPYV